MNRTAKWARNTRKSSAGFTLIELMVALVLTLFLTAGIFLMHSAGSTAFMDSENLSRIQENIRFASDYMIRDIRNAGFRDEIFLKTGHEQQIKAGYATVPNDGLTLRVRYAGRGHCTQAFDEFRLVENEYALDTQTGDLTCRGRTVPRDADGSTQITDQAFTAPVQLVGGLTGIEFHKVCPDGGSTCLCDQVADFDNSCIGVRVVLEFQGMRTAANASAFDERSIELTAAFRNIILDRVNAHAFADEEEEEG